MRGRALALALLGGAFLGAHFAAFTPSLRYTSVASATAIICSQAIWAGVFSRLLGERLPRRAWPASRSRSPACCWSPASTSASPAGR